MPYMSQFMTESPTVFEISTDNARGKAKFEISGKEQSRETLYAKVSLRKIPKSQLKKAAEAKESEEETASSPVAENEPETAETEKSENETKKTEE